jgi:hypothetical protein
MKFLIKLWDQNNKYWTQERSLTALLIYLFISIVSWLPLSERNPWEEAAQDLVFNLILLAGYFSASVDTSLRKGVIRQILLILAIMASVFRALEYFTMDKTIQQIDMITSIIFFLLLAILIFKFVVRDDKEVTAHRVQGAIVVYILVGLLCSFIYYLIYLNNPDSFNFVGHENDDILYAYFIYFSFTVQTTVGAGDIIPGDAWSKSVVIFQSMIGMLYPVVIIARLVTLEIEHTKTKRNNQNQ